MEYGIVLNNTICNPYLNLRKQGEVQYLPELRLEQSARASLKKGDENAVWYIQESPYVQYYLGLHEFYMESLSDSSMAGSCGVRNDADPAETASVPNSGTLIIDATVADADIMHSAVPSGCSYGLEQPPGGIKSVGL